MITPTLQFLETQLNSFLQNNFKLNETVALLSPIIERDGTSPEQSDSKVFISLLHVDPFSNSQANNLPGNRQHDAQTNINMTIMVSTNFRHYVEGLKFLDAVITFFRDNAVFDRSAYPSLPTDVNNIRMTTQSLSLQETQDLWRAIGVTYQPSMVYRVSGS